MGTQLPSPKGVQPPIFGPYLLWPNGWIDEDATWYGSRPRPRPHCVRRGPSSPAKGAQQPRPFFGLVCCGQGHPSQLLLSSCTWSMHALPVAKERCFKHRRETQRTDENHSWTEERKLYWTATLSGFIWPAVELYFGIVNPGVRKANLDICGTSFLRAGYRSHHATNSVKKHRGEKCIF